MSTGTDIIQNSLQKIGAHSVFQPAPDESLETSRVVLNAMLSAWEDDYILLGVVPLKVVTSELSEPMGARLAIENNLALALAPYFPGAQVSPGLRREASRSYNAMARRYKVREIPAPVARDTLPRGQGNRYRDRHDAFFPKGTEIG